MENFVVAVGFLGGLTFLFASGYLIGNLFKLDRFYKDIKEETAEHNLKYN